MPYIKEDCLSVSVLLSQIHTLYRAETLQVGRGYTRGRSWIGYIYIWGCTGVGGMGIYIYFIKAQAKPGIVYIYIIYIPKIFSLNSYNRHSCIRKLN